MRIRLGFVTNSSSTNHIIAWNGNRDDLRWILEEHSAMFSLPALRPVYSYHDDLSYDESLPLTSKEIINAIMSKIQSATSGSKLSGDYDDDAEYFDKVLKEKMEVRQSDRGLPFCDISFYRDLTSRCREIAGRVRDRDWALTISFGDHHGDFIGERWSCMDIRGSTDLDVEDDHLTYATENNS